MLIKNYFSKTLKFKKKLCESKEDVSKNFIEMLNGSGSIKTLPFQEVS